MSYFVSPEVSPKHKCAIAGCEALIGRQFLMCREHWRLVPAAFKVAVITNWKNGGSKAYLAARTAAIRAVEGQGK